MKIKKGFTLVEVIVALAVAALLLPALGKLFTFALNTSSQGDKYSRAYAMSQEGIEAIYYIKENRSDIWDWDTTPDETAADEYYQVVKSAGIWGFDGGKKTEDQLTSEDGFIRSIQIFLIPRDVEGNINSGSTMDPYTRKVVSKVTWVDANGPEEVSISSYVTKH